MILLMFTRQVPCIFTRLYLHLYNFNTVSSSVLNNLFYMCESMTVQNRHQTCIAASSEFWLSFSEPRFFGLHVSDVTC